MSQCDALQVLNLEKLKINRNDKLISLGVTNMFGKIPKEELIKIPKNDNILM